ncbi:MAG TPA: sulfite exporter TauE/SafE family protein [Candidatus Saccharimonadales bacterium]|nr:sulfite exporter TauE/SafE family protein [Candidatus Saccharimonadales bacterium]
MVLAFILLGLIAGMAAGLVGIGGGIIIVPALVYLFHFTQKTAQGTTLALLVPPIGILAAYTYYKAGEVNLKAAGFIIVGFLVGSFLTSHFAMGVSNKTLTRIFAVFLIIAVINMLVKG